MSLVRNEMMRLDNIQDKWHLVYLYGTSRTRSYPRFLIVVFSHDIPRNVSQDPWTSAQYAQALLLEYKRSRVLELLRTLRLKIATSR